MKVVFDTDTRLDFANVEIVYRDIVTGGEIPMTEQVGYFDNFHDIHNAIDDKFDNIIWWDNGDKLFRDVDVFITLSN